MLFACVPLSQCLLKTDIHVIHLIWNYFISSRRPQFDYEVLRVWQVMTEEDNHHKNQYPLTKNLELPFKMTTNNWKDFCAVVTLTITIKKKTSSQNTKRLIGNTTSHTSVVKRLNKSEYVILK